MEMNNEYYPGLLERNDLYAYRVMSRNVQRGDSYADYKTLIQINLDNFNCFKKEISVFKMMEVDTHEIESESLTKYHISLPIITKKYYNKEKLNDLFVATNVNFDGSGMQIKSYDKDKDEYKVIFGGIGGTSGPSPKITARKIISATKQEDGSIKVVEKAIYYTSTIFNDDMYFNIYSDPSNNYNIDGKHFKVSNVTNEKIDVNDYSDKASTITHIFKLDKETGDYYFASSVIK